AIEHYSEMLRLNPNDNQGVRYLLAQLLVRERRDEELGKLLDAYKEEWSANWLYTRALWLFRREGPGRKANAALKKAFEQNPFVPALIAGILPMPERPPEYMGM